MRFFTKIQKNQGWLTIVFFHDGMGAVRVKRMALGKPRVELSVFYPDSTAPLVESLARLGKELQTASFQCSTVLGGLDYQMLTVDAPNVPVVELKSAIRWRLKDMLDFPVEDATVDVLDIPADKNTASQTHSMFAVAARNSVIVQRQNLFTEAKIGLSVIDIPEMAQRNISTLIEADGCGVAMLSFGTDGGLLTVTSNGELYLSRRIDVTLEQLLQTEQDKKDACFDKITLELQRSLDNFDRQFHFINIVKLVLAPTGANGLFDYLSTNLYTPVEALNLADVLDLSMVPLLVSESEQQRYFLALGASLRLEGVLL